MKQGTICNKYNVIDQFDEILFKHLNRLIGSKYGIGELALNSATISLIMLLMERENEMESFPSDEIYRYTRGTLIDDIEEMGFDAVQDMNIVVEEMIRKGYIHAEDDRLIPQTPTISMARLMDAVFPKMPGMNLVAYFVQIMDEVQSERKDLDSATSQFDQVLHMQGVPLEKGPRKYEPSKMSVQSADKRNRIHKSDKSPQNNQNVSPDKELKTPVILGRISFDNLFDQSKASSVEPKVLSSDAYKGKIKIKKLNFGGPRSKSESEKSDARMMTSSEEPAKTVFGEQSHRFDASMSKAPIHDSTSSVEPASCDLKPTEPDKSILDDNKDNFSKPEPSQKKIESVKETVEDNPETGNKKEDFPVNSATLPRFQPAGLPGRRADKDDDIEKRIIAFEEDLALECPICRQSKVLVESTVTGKSYYKCSNKECSFISWGKPHHILCPKCNNPFLIETSNKAGTTGLKCPRATCRYWKTARQDIPGRHREHMDPATQETNKIASISQKPRRRVVRRRVVRRKR